MGSLGPWTYPEAGRRAPAPERSGRYPLTMRSLILVAMLAASPAGAADWIDAAARPAYRTAETISDGIYGLIHGELFSPLLPNRLSDQIKPVPSDTSYSAFQEEFKSKQARALRRIEQARPGEPTSSPERLDLWRAEAIHEETLAVTDAFAATLMSRYQIRRFGDDSRDYASDLDNWDPRFVGSGAVLGGAYLYVAGLRTAWTAGPARMELDLRPGRAMTSCARRGQGRLATLRFSPRGSALELRADWDLRDGRSQMGDVGLSYTRRF